MILKDKRLPVNASGGLLPINSKTPPNFVKRLYTHNYPTIKNKDGSVSTHRMAAEVDEKGDWYVFPMIVQQQDGTLTQFNDSRKAFNWNKQRGNVLKMNNKQDALAYAEGGYKKGTLIDPENIYP